MIIKIQQDGRVYRTHNDVLSSIGIHRTLVHREAVYILFDKWMIWFPNMLHQAGEWINRSINDWESIEQVCVAAADASVMGRDHLLDYVRITFAKDDRGYSFKGVFGNGQQIGDRSARFEKLSDECEIEFNCKLIY